MGAPYEQAVYAGQVAHEMAAAHFEEEVTERERESPEKGWAEFVVGGAVTCYRIQK